MQETEYMLFVAQSLGKKEIQDPFQDIQDPNKMKDESSEPCFVQDVHKLTL